MLLKFSTMLLVAVFAGMAQSQAPTFRSTTRLVEFTVVALDKKGSPVTNLTKEDFTILDNGKPRQIAFFRYEGGPPPDLPPSVKARARQSFTNRVGADSGPLRNVTALLIDSLNTDVRDQIYVKAQLANFLRALAPQSRVGIFQLGTNLRVVHDVSDDMNSLRAAMDKLGVGFVGPSLTDVNQLAVAADQIMDQMQAKFHPRYGRPPFLHNQLRTSIAGGTRQNSTHLRDRVRLTLATLEALGRHMSAIPGRRNVVWITSGVSASTVLVPSGIRAGESINPTVSQGFELVIRNTAERLAQMGVTLYAVDARGLVSPNETIAEWQDPPPAIQGRYQEMARAAQWASDPRAAFSTLTSTTGGRFFMNTNDFSEAIRKAANDMQGCYSIGFYLNEDPDGKWHTLKAAVATPGIEVRHRSGYVPVIAREAGSWDKSTLQSVLTDPLGSSGVRLNAYCLPGDADAGAGAVALTLEIETEDIAFRDDQDHRRGEIEINIGEKAADGTITFHQETIRLNFSQTQWEMARARKIPFRRVWVPDQKTVALRALVRDKYGDQYGTVDISLADVFGAQRGN